MGNKSSGTEFPSRSQSRIQDSHKIAGDKEHGPRGTGCLQRRSDLLTTKGIQVEAKCPGIRVEGKGIPAGDRKADWRVPKSKFLGFSSEQTAKTFSSISPSQTSRGPGIQLTVGSMPRV